MSNGGERRDDDPFTNAVDKAIGLRLRELREALALTQAQVGTAVGMSGQTWKTHEDGVRIPASRLWQFCIRFGIDVHDIFAGLPTRLPDTLGLSPIANPGGRIGVAEEGPTFAGPDADAFNDVLEGLTTVERKIALAAIQGIAGRQRKRPARPG
ncbi:hypothetical protein BH10PSE2_BH10PSE2_12270 [soil metagenome]